MHRGVPRKLSGGNSSLRRARTKEREEMTRDAARVTWLFRAGVGSSSSRKLEVSYLQCRTVTYNGFKLSTTAIMSINSGKDLTIVKVEIRVVPWILELRDEIVQNCSI